MPAVRVISHYSGIINNLFCETLDKMGFKINPYNQCVTNKEMYGKQRTIVWYVDDMKVSHMDIEVVRDILKLIN